MSVEDIFRGVTAGAADDVVQIQRVVVLSAITEAIREKGVDPSPTAYYGALMASLTAQRAGGESDTTVAGATYLLALLLPHLPLAVLRAQAGDAAAVLLACQKNYADSALVARQVLSCLPSLLAPFEGCCAACSSSSSLEDEDEPYEARPSPDISRARSVTGD